MIKEYTYSKIKDIMTCSKVLLTLSIYSITASYKYTVLYAFNSLYEFHIPQNVVLECGHGREEFSVPLFSSLPKLENSRRPE